MQNKDIKLKIFEKNLLSHSSLLDGLPYISQVVKDIVSVQRCSLFVYNIEENKLWTTLADGVEKIIVPFDMGIVGMTFKQKKAIIENDPYDSLSFLSDIDMKTGYYTQNILALPIFDKQKKIIGVLQLLNKEEEFTKEDIKLMTLFCKSIGEFISTFEL